MHIMFTDRSGMHQYVPPVIWLWLRQNEQPHSSRDGNTNEEFTPRAGANLP